MKHTNVTDMPFQLFVLVKEFTRLSGHSLGISKKNSCLQTLFFIANPSEKYSDMSWFRLSPQTSLTEQISVLAFPPPGRHLYTNIYLSMDVRK